MSNAKGSGRLQFAVTLMGKWCVSCYVLYVLVFGSCQAVMQLTAAKLPTCYLICFFSSTMCLSELFLSVYISDMDDYINSIFELSQ